MRIRPSNLWPVFLGFPLAVVAIALGHYAFALPGAYDDVIATHRSLAASLLAAGVPQVVETFARVCGVTAAAMLVVSLLMLFVMRGWVLWLYRKCCVMSYVLAFLYVMLVGKATAALLEGSLSVDGTLVNPVTQFFLRWHLIWPALLAALGVAALHVLVLRRRVISLYTGIHDERPATGDRLIENVLSNGQDPAFRKSVLSSVGLHVLVILVIPWLLTLRGCVEPYRVPKGSGTPATLTAVQIHKVVKKKPKKKRFVVNPRSAISFHIPDLDESVAARQVDEQTQLTYQADPTRAQGIGTAAAGKMGAGGGTTGGWPDGMENAKIRFIHLEYNGAGWDDGMDATSRGDQNFLDRFHQLTGFKVANQPESHPIGLLRKYAKGFAPPFVYFTGEGSINVTESETKTLRDYLLDGGLLFASCRSPAWDRSFRAFAQRLLPGEPLVTISDDDTLFQIPYSFPNGAPPLWHHGGFRALGIKHQGRWVVFYHPGDINDAWKTGHEGLDPAMAEGAMQIGVNVLYYSFTHYLELTRKYRQ